MLNIYAMDVLNNASNIKSSEYVACELVSLGGPLGGPVLIVACQRLHGNPERSVIGYGTLDWPLLSGTVHSRGLGLQEKTLQTA